MRQSVLLICGIIALCFSDSAAANANDGLPQARKDSTPSPSLIKSRITVRDLEDGSPIDSAMVTNGFKTKYTNASGYVEFDSIIKESILIVNKNRYFGTTKK